MAAYYVSIHTGNDANDGLAPERAWATISKAAATLGPGDTAYIAPGTYFEQVSPAASGSDGLSIRYVGDRDASRFPGLEPGEVIIGGADPVTRQPVRDYGFYASGISYLNLESISVQAAAADGVAILGPASDVSISRCHIEAYGSGIHIRNTSNVSIARSKSDGGTTGFWFEAVDLSRSGLTLDSCDGTGGSYGLRITHQAGSGGGAWDLSDVELRGCTFSGGIHGLWVHLNERRAAYSWVSTPVFTQALFAACECNGGTNGMYFSNNNGRYGSTIIRGCRSMGGQNGIAFDSANVPDGTERPRIEACLASGKSGHGINAPSSVVKGCAIHHSVNGVSAFAPIRSDVDDPIVMYRVVNPGPFPLASSLIDTDPPAGFHLDRKHPLAGNQSGMLKAPTVARHVIPVLIDALPAIPAPVTVRLLARKNFDGGEVVFSFGEASFVLADLQTTQVVNLAYTPTRPSVIELEVRARTDVYHRQHAVWIDDVEVA